MPDFFTSGTTGPATKLVLSEHLLLERAKRRSECRSARYSSLRGLLCLLREGSTAQRAHMDFACLKGMRFLGQAAALERVIEERPDGVVGEPITLLALGTQLQGRLKFNYVGATHSFLDPNIAKAIRETLLAPYGEAEVTYGASQVGSISRGSFADAEETPGCVGRPHDGVLVALGSAGEIEVTTPTMLDPDQWFPTGDRGRIDPQGRLILERFRDVRR